MSTDHAPGEIMLFGVRVVVDTMRKSVSLNNLSQYEHHLDAAAAAATIATATATTTTTDPSSAPSPVYASADDASPHLPSSASTRERKRGVPWTEEEHKLFLIGLQKVGKGDWRGISRNFVKTRTPTQVASHAQKYFLRKNNISRRRRRSSLFDITTDTVTANAANEQQTNGRGLSQSPAPSEMSGHYSVNPIHPILFSSPAAQPSNSDSMVSFNLNNNLSMEASPLSLNLSLSSMATDLAIPPSSTRSAFQAVQGISVA